MKSDKRHKVKISGTGIYIPDNCYTNDDVIDIIKTHLPKDDPRRDKLSSKWIEDNIGIKTRYFADLDRTENPETASNISLWSLQDALTRADWKPEDLDAIIVCSVSSNVSPEFTMIPSIAAMVQKKVGAWNAMAYDQVAACSGWTYGAGQAISFISSGMAKKVAVICTETQKRGLEFENPVSSVLIGDLSVTTLFEESSCSNVMYVDLQANTEKDDPGIITLATPNPYNPSEERPLFSKFRLVGKTVFKEGVRRMSKMTTTALEATGLEKEEIKAFIFHQANGAMLMMVGGKLQLSPTQVPITLDKYANTTSCTIPSVLHDCFDKDQLKKGDKVVFVSFGGGITAGAIVMEI